MLWLTKPKLRSAMLLILTSTPVFRNHGFVSAQAFAEIYASTFNEHHQATRKYIDYSSSRSQKGTV